MMLLNFVRMLGDLAFYYSFAGFVVACTGSSFSLPGLLIPALCYALSSGLRDRKPLRMAVLLPELLCFLIPQLTWADRIAVIPAICYTVYMAWIDNYELSHYRQTDVFNLFWKIYICFFILLCLLGGFQYLKSGSLPIAVITLLADVYLLRVLRHDPETYHNTRFLLRSLIPLAAIAVIAWVLQIPAVLNTVASALQAVYSVTLVPILMGISYVLGYIIMFLMSPLKLFAQDEDSSELDTDTTDLTEGVETGTAGATAQFVFQVLKAIAIIAVIVAVVLLLVYLFRRLAGKKSEAADSSMSTQQRRTSDPSVSDSRAQTQPFSPRDPVSQVRRQYRRYLRLCLGKGFTPHESYTSAEIVRNTENLFSDPAPAEELRQLYLEARYHSSATKEDAGRAKELVNQLKQQSSR